MLELNEPTMIRIWPALGLYSTAFRIARRFSRERKRAVLYAIDNLDLLASIRKKVPRPWTGFAVATARLMMRYLISTFDRIAFGSEGAKVAYLQVAGGILAQKETRLVPQVPARCACAYTAEMAKNPGSVLFVGSLEQRKGIRQLLEAWPIVVGDLPNATLTIVGTGPLEQEVREWARDHDVEFVHDPARERVHFEFARAECVVLLSQPADYWREQIGLPIVEGLAHGCRVVASEQTGIASWLKESGHTIVSSAARGNEVARAIEAAVARDDLAEEILAQLPKRHTRLDADEWLTS
ncbi:glycosyltransferase family 4 protein [Agromyces protaetiae]|uniref:glycosyltransferase family 4 protein n=1 Tax=Agromyces protaetiae TaxID=2509455 RepID=UPI0013ECFB4A|nr:glycosyltransferase family 4 protein [Agromyces protaetiae]